MNKTISFEGRLTAKLIKPKRVGWGWRLRNTLRLNFMLGWLFYNLAFLFTKVTKVPTLVGKLEAVLIRADGTKINYGVLSYRMVTDAFTAYVVDDWDSGANAIDNFNYHGCGTDDTPGESATDTALQLECTTALNPDSTRATGTKSQPSANIMRSVGTLTFDAPAAIVEHGFFTQASVPGGTLADRSVFGAINVVNLDSIQFTYSLTLNSGG